MNVSGTTGRLVGLGSKLDTTGSSDTEEMGDCGNEQSVRSAS